MRRAGFFTIQRALIYEEAVLEQSQPAGRPSALKHVPKNKIDKLEFSVHPSFMELRKVGYSFCYAQNSRIALSILNVSRLISYSNNPANCEKPRETIRFSAKISQHYLAARRCQVVIGGSVS